MPEDNFKDIREYCRIRNAEIQQVKVSRPLRFLTFLTLKSSTNEILEIAYNIFQSTWNFIKEKF